MTALMYFYAGINVEFERILLQREQDLNKQLEQNRILTEELAAEKASVEQKVIDRTRELSEARAQLEVSIRSLPFGFAIVNPADQIVFHNQHLSTYFNCVIPDEPEASRQILEQVSANFSSAFNLLADIQEVKLKGQQIERNVEIGPRFFRFLMIPIIGDNKKGVIGMVLVVEDNTDSKALERSRDEFFSIASHELRTPLTAIRGNSDRILDHYKEQLKDETLSELVTDIHGASIRLIAIVNDFLDVSRLEQKKFSFKNVDFDIVSLINQTLREYEVTGSRNKLYLELDSPAEPMVSVHGDPDRIRQILINLIGNGLKFTTEGGVKLRLQPKDHILRVLVSDTGRGIPVEFQHLLFRKFQQATDSILTRDSTKGTGLGLYISQLLAEGMGGKLYLDHTEVGKGSTFALELHLAVTSLATTKAPSQTPPKA
jgi:signal transduction histidine kinase